MWLGLLLILLLLWGILLLDMWDNILESLEGVIGLGLDSLVKKCGHSNMDTSQDEEQGLYSPLHSSDHIF
jgi:hypothetical protein